MTDAPLAPRPDLAILEAHLRPLLPASPSDGTPALVREPNPRSSYYDSEILTVAWPSGRAEKLLLKYNRGDGTMADGLLRIGPSYEAIVYRDVLSQFNVTTPKLIAYLDEPNLSAPVLVLEFREGVHANRAPERTAAIGRAAGLIGRLHALAAPVVSAGALPPLNVYHARLYRYWAERTLAFERRTLAGRSWLPRVIDQLDAIIEVLCGATQTVIHGDYYCDNMVVHQGEVSVFDWEQTAIAPGEIDLASLTHNWHAEVIEAAEGSYIAARWPDGAPDYFARTLDAARVFVLLRLLGNEPGWPDRPMRRHRADQLRILAERLGLL